MTRLINILKAYLRVVRWGAAHRCKFDNNGYCAECDRYDGEW